MRKNLENYNKMSIITLNFFGEEVKIKSPQDIKSLRDEISKAFLFSKQDADEIILSYTENGDKILIDSEEDFKIFLTTKINKINLDISQNSLLYQQNLNKIEEESMKEKELLGELLKKDEKYFDDLKETKFANEKKQIQEIDEQIRVLNQKRSILRKIVLDGLRSIEIERKETQKKINELQKKLGIESTQEENVIIKKMKEIAGNAINGINALTKNVFAPKIKEEENEIVLHQNKMCDLCKMTPIKGNRYKCNTCSDFDLCEQCYEKTKTCHCHEFTKFEKPEIKSQKIVTFKRKAHKLRGAARPKKALLLYTPTAPRILLTATNFDYPIQEFRLGIFNTNRNINISGFNEGSALNSWITNGEENENWYLNYISSGVYEIVNSKTGFLITNNNGKAVLSKDSNASNQRWHIESVQNDFDGFNLYYKIVSTADNSSALTFVQNGNYISTETYSGKDYQKFKLNLRGLEGYAGNCAIGGNEKAGTIGGLLGETVYVSDLQSLVTQLDSKDPKTIVLKGNVDFSAQSKEKQRIRDNKTLVGCYGNHSIYDSQLRNDDFYGSDNLPSLNIVIKNIDFVAKTLTNNCGVICLYFYGVRNLWLDHCNFSATFGQDKDNEVGKFCWINTPVDNWSDGKYNSYNPDYITISYNHFKNRFWTFAFGSQNKDTSRIRSSVMFNKWEECSRRCPQYGNGTAHNYCNFHTIWNGVYNQQASQQVIAGEGTKLVNENCRFEGYVGLEVSYDSSAISACDSGSYTAKTASDTPYKFSMTAKGSAFKPTDSYTYTLVDTYNNNGTDVKEFVNNYSGCFNNSVNYITDSALKNYQKTINYSSFLKNI